MRNITFILFLTLLFFVSCKKDRTQEMIEKEKAQLKAELSDSNLLAYKSLKYLIRSSGSGGLENEDVFLKVLNSELDKVSIKEIYQFVKQIIKIEKTIEEDHEDNYPTIMNILLHVYDETGEMAISGKYWNSSVEHMIIALMHQRVESSNKKFVLYEASLICPDSLPGNELLIAGLLFKSMILTDFGYVYLAENDLSVLVDNIEGGQMNYEVEIMKTQVKDDKQKDFYLGLSYFSRAMVKYRMNDVDRATEAENDLEKFFQIAENIGIDNELSLIAGLYLNSGNEKEALGNLKRLKKSNLLDKDQKKMIKKLIDEVEAGKKIISRETLSYAIDERKIIVFYLSNLILKSEYVSGLKESRSGRFVFRSADNFTGALKQYKKYSDTKEMLNKGKELIDDLFN